MARQIVVEIVGDARKFSGTLTEATGKAEGFGARLKNVGKGVAIGAGVAGFNLLTTAVSTAVSKLDEMHDAFLEDEASQARLANTIKNTVTNYEAATKAVEDFAQAQLKMGFDDAATRDSVEQLIGQTHDAAEAIKLATLAADIARAKNIDLATATDAVTRAYNGQTRALAGLGVDVQGAVGRAQILARAFNNVRGAQEAYAKTGAGRVAAANVKMQETMEKVGGAIDKVSQFIIPIMVDGLSELVDIAGDLIGWFTDLANLVGGALSNAFALFGANVASTAGWLATLRDIAKTILNGVLPGSVGLGGGGGGTIDVSQPGSHNIGVLGVPVGDTGGIVGGAPGSHSLIIAAAGERLTMPGQSAGQTIIVNIASFIGSDRDIDRFSDRLAFRLRSTSLS